MLVALQVEGRTSSQITPPAGWTTVSAATSDNSVYTQMLFYRFATAADVSPAAATWTWDWAGSHEFTASLLVFRGVDGAAPVNAAASALATTTAAAITIPAVTPSVDGTVLVGVAALNRGATFAWAAPMAETTDVASGGGNNNLTQTVATEAGPAANTSSGARTATASRTDNRRAGQMVALAPAAVSGPALRWRFDEGAWSGAANEVRDASGNLLAGTAFGGGATATTTAANNGNAAFCRSGLFSAASAQYVETANDARLAPTDRFTVAAWVRPSRWPAAGGLMTILSKDTNYEFHVDSSGALYWWWSGGANAITTAAGSLPVDTWTHVAIVYARGAQEVYLNGALAAQNWANPDRNAATANALPLQVGADQGVAGRYFDGQIDEVRVYGYAMSAADVLALRNEVPAPVCPVDHFVVTPAGGASASTCTAKSFSIVAQDVNNATLASYDGTVSLLTSTARGDWAPGAGAAGVLNNGAADDGSAQYAFNSGDAGDTALSLTDRSQDDLSVTVRDTSDPSIAGTSASVAFRDNALLFAEDLAGRIAGSDVAVAGRPHDLRATYVYKDAATGTCGILTKYSGAKNLKAWLTRDAADPAGAAPALGAVALPNAAPAANNVTLTFNAGVADFTLATSDVGKYALNLRDDAPGVANTSVAGVSGVLTVRPFTLAVRDIRQGATVNPGGGSPSGAAFAAAGTAFQMTVEAYRHSAAADADDDGLPDAAATLAQVAAGGIAPSFSATASFSAVAPYAPAPGGSLANGAVQLTAGTATPGDLSFSEVGSFTLSTRAVTPSYLGTAGVDLDATVFDAAGSPITAAPVIGRFRPDHFVLVGAGTLTNRADLACAPASGFTYLGERLSVAFRLGARNAQGQPTVNYTSASGYAKLDPAVIAQLGLGAASGATDLTSRLDLSGGSSGTFLAGEAAVTASVAVARATPDNPDGPYAAARLGIAPADSDGTAMRAADFDMDADGTGGNDHAQVGATELRFGRLRLDNAFGSDRTALPLAMTAEYWTGSGFATNTLDSCTVVPRNAITLDFTGGLDLGPCETAVSVPSVTLSAGRARVLLSAPGGNRGRVTVGVNLDSSDGRYCDPASYVAAGDIGLDYLLGRWNDAANPDGDAGTGYDDEPAAIGAFGVYGSQPGNFIYFRERY